jgi:hypothetical protein
LELYLLITYVSSTPTLNFLNMYRTPVKESLKQQLHSHNHCVYIVDLSGTKLFIIMLSESVLQFITAECRATKFNSSVVVLNVLFVCDYCVVCS